MWKTENLLWVKPPLVPAVNTTDALDLQMPIADLPSVVISSITPPDFYEDDLADEGPGTVALIFLFLFLFFFCTCIDEDLLPTEAAPGENGQRRRASSYNDVFARLTQSSSSSAALDKLHDEAFCPVAPLHGAAGRAVEPLFVLKGHTGAVTDVTVDEAGRVLVTASRDGTVKRWDIATQQHISDPWFHPTFVRALACSSRLVVTACENIIRLFDISLGRMVQLPLEG